MSTTSSTKSTPPPYDAPSTRLNEGTVAKEVRAHAHARHRTKERREHALAKERKEKAAAVRVLGLRVAHAAHGARPVRKLSMENWDGEEPEGTRRSAGDSDAVAGPRLQEPEPKPGCDVAVPIARQTNAFTELTLGDVISKPRRLKAKELDFEVVPPIRAVIVLDDAFETDEPWEYVTRASLNDRSAWKGKSYAQAVVSVM